MNRRFVAVAVPAAVREELDAAVASLRAREDHAWTVPAGWHVTLAFLGPLPEPQVPEAVEVVGRVVRATPGSIGLRLGDPARFGSRVLVVGVADDPAGSLAALAERLQTALADVGLPVARRSVRPHVTLARARRRSAIDDRVVTDVARALRADDAAGLGRSPRAWEVDAVGLWSSVESHGPARYATEVEVALPGGEA